MYLIEVCCSFDLKSESISLTPAHIEPDKTLIESLPIKDIWVTDDQPETASSQTLANNSSHAMEYHSDSIALFVTGQILTEKGIHSGNDKIRLYSPSLNEKYIAKSDATGYFQIDKVLAADDYQLDISARGMYQKHYERVAITMQPSYFLIQLKTQPVSTLRGQVSNIDKIPVANFKLKVSSSEVSRWERILTTDSIGHFELDDVPVGLLTFTSMHNQVLSIRGHELHSNQHQLPGLIVDEGSYSISGIVFDNYGEPAVGANVLLSWQHRDGKKRTTSSRRAITRHDGSFSLHGFGPGWHNLVVADISSGSTHNQDINFIHDYEATLIHLE
jgi:hypothetical protein